MSKSRSHDEFLNDLNSRQPEIFALYTIIGKYVGNHKYIEVLCNSCGFTSNKMPSKLLSGRGCNNCRLLGKEYITNKLNSEGKGFVFGDIDFSKSTKQVIEYSCPNGHSSSKPLRKLLEKVSCTQCSYDSMKTPEKLQKHLSKLPHIKLVGGTYINCKSKLLFECNRHGLFEKAPDKFINKDQTCPYCVRDNFKFYTKTLADRNKDSFLNIITNVYLIEIEDIGYKVGISSKPKTRFSTINRDSGKSVNLIKIFEMDLYRAIYLEDKVLKHFKRKDIPNTFAGYKEVLDANMDDILKILEGNKA